MPAATNCFNTRCQHYPGRWLFPVHPVELSRVACRLCYDASRAAAAAFPRKAVRQMVCAFCACAQPCGAACANPDCTASGVRHRYYCGVCHLWEQRPAKSIYHCVDCAICRVGPAEDYEHCGNCGMCVPKARPHKCWGQLAGATCPVCYDACDAAGRESISFLRCGHALHTECWRQLLQHGHFKCPSCGRLNQL
jgi:hypothetical protein